MGREEGGELWPKCKINEKLIKKVKNYSKRKIISSLMNY